MIIDGFKHAQKIKQELKEEIEKNNLTLKLAVVLVGNNPSSLIYVKNKKNACKEVGIQSEIIKLEESISQEKLNQTLKSLSNDKSVNGILLQLPLPKHLDESQAISYITPEKDVDGLTQVNMGKLISNQNGLKPCTPCGIMELIKSVKSDLAGHNAVVVGRSNLVGKPIAQMLLNENCTVTICHSKTRDLKKITKQADILIIAVGQAKFIKKNMVKKSAIVIDVGINKTPNGLVGDVDFEKVKNKASHITPVPKGVGPMTVAMLLKNVLLAGTNNPK